ncbi:MAG: hypothetical protein RI897_246 [Verrucomicrobiota bacterium]
MLPSEALKTAYGAFFGAVLRPITPLTVRDTQGTYGVVFGPKKEPIAPKTASKSAHPFDGKGDVVVRAGRAAASSGESSPCIAHAAMQKALHGQSETAAQPHLSVGIVMDGVRIKPEAIGGNHLRVRHGFRPA